MGELQALLENHGLLLVFLNVLVEQAGLPVPAYPMLFVAGALGVQETGPSIGAVLAAVIVACLIADTGWYFAGRRLGQPMLRTICKVSISPDSCIRQTQSLYLRVGPRSLVVAKLLPGAGALSTAMAGMTGTPLPVFLFYDALGALVWAGSGLLIGVVFSDFIDAILEGFSTYGHMALAAVVGAFLVFLAWRSWRRLRLLRITKRVPRMSVDELESRRLAGALPVVIDVRAHGDVPMERIPGSMVLDMQGALDSLDALGVAPAEADIVVYCACPNEMSAALLAERLRVAGYPRTWALAGGFDEWKRRHGETVPPAVTHPGPGQARAG
ncbi:DedA family protein/thiosulfate sulfurtransferase GlpE [Cupriavidus alkaliphilus]|uniref:DedA family protein/thiosulfate sulfurtransferase GlpE n=1 Tax=Cupriavidus alkaliphilus TaxID=942866 RepID=UPI00081577C6|nr:DedA family protein/thiosulfate sulfurtransferase GlpE [Cupriavidus alkaliphilus]SCB27530.1 membrane protein DedA, SNARE-associated domain [Cupriavidus alkaliphilus]